MTRAVQRIVRYRASTRINHWLVAISFVLLALSGLALYHPATAWLAVLFGGGPWTRILHPYVGVFMAIAFALLAATVGGANRVDPADREWLRRWRDVVTNNERDLPDVGRYNGGQKLLFWTIVACMLVLLLSGLVIWRAWFTALFPIEVVRFAAVAHAAAATVLICAIVVHVYAAIWVKGSVRAMTRGTVSPGWAWKHHRAWFREVLRGGGRE